ncbi:retropepsin-like aspartic protease family protein [Sphingobium algorifonticola]|uniref:TIGR02281 family clan AA aspartic protease n=1 Tax=Sphingobium algorifonticola TaxID=2008318 RepID=A0A437J6A9_9SPHN|nr:TIGR02281 family clan AA aspartic protease [Sphingobium algorifonticola]RVT40705.1 TIGR02281 family clan AA aspartic protease [Sphingobium algorifonticola]
MIWYALILLLVGSAFLTRRVPWRSAFGMILAWIAIFAVVLVAISYREELAGVFRRVSGDVLGRPRQTTDGSSMRVAVASDGHYWVEGTINGTSARFLIDSGATVTALSTETARAAGIVPDRQRMPVVMQTANGPVEAQRARVTELVVGSIRMHDVPVVVAPQFGKINVIGMNMLSRLQSWQVRNGEMVLEP